jgi:putative PIN family toxin of toxin-antitoxin system
MNSRERILDTNVVVSALLFEQSTFSQTFYAALDLGDILLLLPVLKELIDVLGRKKFERYLLREERERFLDALVRETTLVDITENICVCRDPKGEHYAFVLKRLRSSFAYDSLASEGGKAWNRESSFAAELLIVLN